MSKLYTEEQLRKAWNTAYVDALSLDKEYYKPIFYDDFIASLTPIELPTLEEIELKSVEYSTDTETKEFYKDCCWDFQNGAKWVLNKIKGGNNE